MRVLILEIQSITSLRGDPSVNVFYRINQDHSQPTDGRQQTTEQRQFDRQAREFRIGSIGFADSSGILLASLIAVPTELALCQAQVHRGKTLCATL